MSIYWSSRKNKEGDMSVRSKSNGAAFRKKKEVSEAGIVGKEYKRIVEKGEQIKKGEELKRQKEIPVLLKIIEDTELPPNKRGTIKYRMTAEFTRFHVDSEPAISFKTVFPTAAERIRFYNKYDPDAPEHGGSVRIFTHFSATEKRESKQERKKRLAAEEEYKRNHLPKLTSGLFQQKTGANAEPEANASDPIEKIKQVNDTIPKGVVNPTKHISTIEIPFRDPEVRKWVLTNAKGICELCDQKGPFVTKSGRIFLEAHHVEGASNFDTPNTTVALCPNCHRKCHYANNADLVKEELIKKVDRLQIK